MFPPTRLTDKPFPDFELTRALTEPLVHRLDCLVRAYAEGWDIEGGRAHEHALVFSRSIGQRGGQRETGFFHNCGQKDETQLDWELRDPRAPSHGIVRIGGRGASSDHFCHCHLR